MVTPYQMAIANARYLNLNKFLIKKITAQTYSQPSLPLAKNGFNISKEKRFGFSQH